MTWRHSLGDTMADTFRAVGVANAIGSANARADDALSAIDQWEAHCAKLEMHIEALKAHNSQLAHQVDALSASKIELERYNQSLVTHNEWIQNQLRSVRKNLRHSSARSVALEAVQTYIVQELQRVTDNPDAPADSADLLREIQRQEKFRTAMDEFLKTGHLTDNLLQQAQLEHLGVERGSPQTPESLYKVLLTPGAVD